MRCKSLSSSKIKTYKDCEFKFLIEYHLGLNTGKTFPAEQGSLVHYILERFALAIRDGQDADGHTLEWLEANWIDLLFEGYPEYSGEMADGYRGKSPIWQLSAKAVDRAKSCDSCPFFKDGECGVTGQDINDFRGCPKDEFEDAIWLVQEVINDNSCRNPLKKKIIAAEDRFTLVTFDEQGNEILTNGIMDLVLEHDSETIEVLDYKTGKHTQSYNECKKDPQFLIYALAAMDLYPQYKHVLLTAYYIRRKSGPITVEFDKEELEKAKNGIRFYANRIKKNRMPQRRCPDPGVKFDHVCKYMCDPTLCNQVYKKFLEQGGKTSE